MHRRGSSGNSDRAADTACLSGRRHSSTRSGPSLSLPSHTTDGETPAPAAPTALCDGDGCSPTARTVGRQLSPCHRRAGRQATAGWESSSPHRRTAAGSHIAPSLPSHAQKREACCSATFTHLHPWDRRGSWLEQPYGTSSLRGQTLHVQGNAARRMKGWGWPRAAGPQRHQLLFALHRKGRLTGHNFREQCASPQAAETPCALGNVAAGHRHSWPQTPEHLGCCAWELIPHKLILPRCLAPWK